MKVAFLYDEVAFGRHRPPLDFSDVESNGLTGTDAVCVHYAREFAKRGHEVTVFAARATPTHHDGIEVQPFTQWKTAAPYYDVAIATGSPNALADALPSTLRIVNRQCARFGNDTPPNFLDFTDIVTCPSETARDHVAAGYDRAKFRVQPNGCYPKHFEGIAKIPGRCVYTSSPDRGLHLLLQAWPHIRRAVPNATLRIFYYSLDSWLRHHTAGHAPSDPLDEECQRRARYIQLALSKLTNHGIEIVGGVSHRQLEREIAQAECFTYPCSPLAFTETFSVATLEALAAGAVPIITSADSLGQIYRASGAQFADGVQDFAARTIRALSDPDFRGTVGWKIDAARFAADHAWPVLAERFETMIYAERPHLTNGVSLTGHRHGDPQTRTAIRVEAAINALPVVHMVLSDYASGGVAIDPSQTKDDHGGGCRAGFLGLVRALAKTGRYRVKAFANVTNETNRDDVKFHKLDQRSFIEKPDVLFAYYDTKPLIGAKGCLRIASHHTFSIPCPASVEWADVNTAPSDYARDALAKVYGGTWRTMPNGFELGDVPPRAPVPGRVIYHTSPDRGLHLLLEAWPHVRERFPSATLHVVGDVDGWLKVLRSVANKQGDIARRVEAALPTSNAAGVTFTGRLSRAALDRELAQASCFAFPCAPALACETFSIAVLECLARGLPVVLAPADALDSIYSGHYVRARHEPKEFAKAVVETLNRGESVERMAEKDREFAARYSFEQEARALDAIISGRKLGDALDSYGAKLAHDDHAANHGTNGFALDNFMSATA